MLSPAIMRKEINHPQGKTVTHFLTTAEAAAIIGVTEMRMRQYLNTGMIPQAKKHGRDWLIPTEAAKSFERPSGKPGPKPRKKRRTPRK